MLYIHFMKYGATVQKEFQNNIELVPFYMCLQLFV